MLQSDQRIAPPTVSADGAAPRPGRAWHHEQPRVPPIERTGVAVHGQIEPQTRRCRRVVTGARPRPATPRGVNSSAKDGAAAAPAMSMWLSSTGAADRRRGAIAAGDQFQRAGARGQNSAALLPRRRLPAKERNADCSPALFKISSRPDIAPDRNNYELQPATATASCTGDECAGRSMAAIAANGQRAQTRSVDDRRWLLVQRRRDIKRVADEQARIGIIVDEDVDAGLAAGVAHRMAQAVVEVVGPAYAHRDISCRRSCRRPRACR